ncbi:MerR family transcriptional regulator [Dyadobacter aurulentus]|uniref:MerR family transcriptional regulator n=1 Tax=Dyadobacter sp. UC 10 TaxID=2605428 RepID=UPI0011F16723|nr:MerR family transcriptional regulator [Dyadobacter sp. UC 10]KAA0992527.1 MerR family transcriptional regulator [Dyadobacter sp. UC 10]
MSSYSIKDLERISNMKAHTIRIWEQRYGLLTPGRTDTNIRYYDDEQLKKLLNVCTLLNQGMKISRISQLNKRQMAEEIDKVIAGSFQSDNHVEAIVNQALIATATFDAAMFEEAFGNAVKKFGIKKTYEKVIYPLLVRTGLLWVKDDLLPSQEHFLSNLVRQKLFAAIDSLPLPENSSQKWLLYLNEQEDHEIGLLFANYLIRQRGQNVIYLGARVPHSDLAHVVKQCRPSHIYSFIIGNHDQLDDMLRKLITDFGDSMLCLSCGNPDMRKKISEYPITQIGSIDKLIEMLNDAE